MSTPDVESRLTELLHRRAEHTMSHTDTQAEVLRFRDDLEARRPRSRRRVLATASAVAAVAAAAVVVWAAGPTDEGAEPAPVQQPVTGEAAADVAAEFLAAYAAGDVQAAAALVTPGREPWPEWKHDVRTDRAWAVEYLWKGCRAVGSGTAGTEVACPFDLNVMHSAELGIGPFHGSKFTVMVEEDGDVLGADRSVPYEINGVGDHLDSVLRWVKVNHPADWRLLDKDSEQLSAAQQAHWVAVWAENLQRYLEAHS